MSLDDRDPLRHSKSAAWNPREHYKNTKVAESYDKERFTSLAGRFFNWLERRAIRRAFAGLKKASQIADVPCGTGRLAEVILQSGYLVVGVDISPAMLAVAREKLDRFGNRFSTKVMDARELADDGQLFDAVLCARFLMHFPVAQQTEFVRGLARIARERIVFTQGIITPAQRVRRKIKSVIGLFQKPAQFPLTPQQLDKLLEDAGLREIRRYYPLPLLSESCVVVAERRI